MRANKVVFTSKQKYYYIHRKGRTGRAGEKGYTCLFVDPKNFKVLEEIESTIGFKIPRRSL